MLDNNFNILVLYNKCIFIGPYGAQVPSRAFKALWAHGAQVPFKCLQGPMGQVPPSAFKALWALWAHGALMGPWARALGPSEYLQKKKHIINIHINRHI